MIKVILPVKYQYFYWFHKISKNSYDLLGTYHERLGYGLHGTGFPGVSRTRTAPGTEQVLKKYQK